MARKKKRRRKLIGREVRETPKGTYRRVRLGPLVLGKNNHPFKQHEKVDHYHIGQRVKYVKSPKELKGWWVKWKGRYERPGKVIKGIIKEKLSISIRKGRGKKRGGNRQGDKEN